MNLTILGLQFDIPTRYAEGHKCSTNEAAALNQTMLENVRNNRAKRIKEVIDEAGGAEKVTPQQVAELQKEISEYASTYTFYPSPARIADPVENLARRTAWDIVKDGLRKNPNVKMKDLTDDDKNKLIDDILTKNPKIRDFAKNQIAAQRKLLAGG